MRKGFMRGTLIGALVGGVAALLLAPKSGKETREDLRTEGQRRLDQAKEASEKLRSRTNREVENAKSKARTTSRQVQSEVKDKVDSAAEEVEKRTAPARRRTTRPRTTTRRTPNSR